MKTYRGLITVEGNEIWLETGGVRMRLDGTPEQFVSLAGIFTTISGEQKGDVIQNAAPVSTPESAAASLQGIENFEPVITVIKQFGDELSNLPGVLGVRPGFTSSKETFVSSPAIIVVTKPNKNVDNVPAEIGGISVEKLPATPREMVEGITPLSIWEGSVLEAAPNIAYERPTDVFLEEVKVHNITCHIGPDSGWKTLKPFLEGTTEKLTVAMYEFYADHIVETMTRLGEESEAKLNIILQVSSNDETIESKLRAAWGDRLEFTKASVSGSHRVFNNSYHTKVAVRDSSAFWLSSGNWSPLSQPLINAGSEQTLYNKGNREWHVIIENEELAKIFEKFIEHDISQAREAETEESVEVMPDLLIPESAFFEAEAAVLQNHPFNARTFAVSAPVSVKPLMSPDNYADEILNLIQNAERSLYLQFSYIRQPSQEKFNQIITAIAEKMNSGLDVRVLVGSSQERADTDLLLGIRQWKREMFRRQKSKIHNKGIIIDGKIAVVGSNNWSSDGTQYNRDASLIFSSRPIAQYFTEVFLFDWDNLSAPFGNSPEVSPVIAPPNEPTPLGIVRIPWRAWFDD